MKTLPQFAITDAMTKSISARKLRTNADCLR